MKMHGSTYLTGALQVQPRAYSRMGICPVHSWQKICRTSKEAGALSSYERGLRSRHLSNTLGDSHRSAGNLRDQDSRSEPTKTRFWCYYVSGFATWPKTVRPRSALPLAPLYVAKYEYLLIRTPESIELRVCWVSRSETLKSWSSKTFIIVILRSRSFSVSFSKAGITGILQCIEIFVWKYRHWVKSESSIPTRLVILRAVICLVSF